MRRDEIRQALDEYADRDLGTPQDLAPAVRRAAMSRQPGPGRIVIEPAGRRAGRLWPAALLAVLVAAVLLGPLLLPGGPSGPVATPAPPAPTTPASPVVAATPAALAPADAQAYGALLLTSFAKRLGVGPDTLDGKFRAAAMDTIDQAVRDGALTPAAAAQAKVEAGQGLAAFFARGFADGGANPAPADMSTLFDQWLATMTTK